MRIKVLLFALAKERAKCSEAEVELPQTATVADVRRALAQAFPDLAPLLPNVMIAVDAEYCSDDRAVSASSEVAVIPPVSGGTGALPVHQSRLV